MEYHALVTGLPVIKPDDEKPRITLQEFEADIMPQLSKDDQHLVSLYLLRYDNRNLLAVLCGKEDYDDRGLYSREQLEQAIDDARRGDTSSRTLPTYIYTFAEAYETLGDTLPEDELSRLYFQYALKAKNKMIREWFEFERDSNNLFTVFIGQQHGFDARGSIIGDDEVSTALRTNTQADFGLSTTLSCYSDIRRIAYLEDAVDTERELDTYRFKWLADKTFFHYFTIERIFAYVIMIDIIERWSRLDAETGQQVFRELINTISNKAELPEEFRK